VTATYLARVYISLKPTVNDPAGNTIQGALANLGYTAESVRSGKFFKITLDSDSAEAARQSVEEMCRRLLANPVIETYELEVEPVGR
jgi:phosphoribosylformylglycinamidine synthase